MTNADSAGDWNLAVLRELNEMGREQCLSRRRRASTK